MKQTDFSRAHRREYRRKVQLCLDVFETMLAQSSFEFDRPLTGMEIECNLVDADYQPAMSNSEVLASIADPAYQTELGAYNIEFNVPPRPLPGRAALELEADVRASLNAAEAKANARRRAHRDDRHPADADAGTPFRPLDERVDALSGAQRFDLHRPRRGHPDRHRRPGAAEPADRRRSRRNRRAPACSCTCRSPPPTSRRNWNAAQVLAGPQLALGANSPYFFGHQLWSETRIELFTQATDTRPDELKTQGVRPRVWFGERWITSIFDLFEENVRYFPSLLPELSDEDPVGELAEGRTPQLAELRLHNGTIYRWNRPVYDVVDGRPHLRVENRVLPAGPTVVDMMANSAFYYGMLRTLSEEDRPLWTKMSFAAAQHNFLEAAQHGMDARLYWPGLGEVTPDELVLRQLLPMADEGLRRWGVAERGARPVSRRDRGPRQDRTQRRGLAGGDGAGAAGTRHDPARRAGRDAAAVLRADAQQRARAHLGLIRVRWSP